MAGEAGEQVADLLRRRAQRRDEAGAHPSQRRIVRRLRVPAVLRERDDAGATLLLDAVDVVPGRILEGDAEIRRDGRAQRRDRTLRQPRDGEHGVDECLAVGHLPEDVEAAADLRVLERAQIAVDVEHDVVELVGVRLRVAQLEVAMDLRIDQQLPDLVAQRRRLRRVHHRYGGVRVEELFESRQIVVRVGPSERRR